MTCSKRFTQTLAFAALAIFLLPPLHAQTATNAKPGTHSGNMVGNHKDIMSTDAPGGNGSSQQDSEVRTEKIKYKQDVGSTQIAPADDNDPARHHPTGGTTTAPASGSSVPYDYRPQIPRSDSAASPAGSSGSPSSGDAGMAVKKQGNPTNSNNATTDVDKENYKQDFGQVQTSRKN